MLFRSKNPSALAVVDGAVYVATHGEYNDAYGTDADDKRGIEKVDVSKKSSKLYISGEDLGGGVKFMAVEDGIAYVAIDMGYDEAFNAKVEVRKVDLSSKEVSKIEEISDASGSIAVKNGKLYAGDRSASKIAVWKGEKRPSIKQPKGALPPYSIALF